MSTQKAVPVSLACQEKGLAEDTARNTEEKAVDFDLMDKILGFLNRVISAMKSKLCPRTLLEISSCDGCQKEGSLVSFSLETPPHGVHFKQWAKWACGSLNKLI
jgi:hypothetical protein